MAEVIDLLSSSPPHNPAIVKSFKSKPETAATGNSIFDFEFDDFDTTGDLSFCTEQATKRRRLNPSPVPPPKATITAKSGATIVLSSEPDLPELQALSGTASGSRLTISHRESQIDDIVFSSSAPELRRPKQKPRIPPDDAVFDLSSDSLPDDPLAVPKNGTFLSSQPLTGNGGHHVVLTDITASFQGRTTDNSSLTVDERLGKFSVPEARTDSKSRLAALVDDIIVSSPPKRQRRKAKQSSKETVTSTSALDDKAEREAIKARERAEKDAQKDVEQQRKRQLKEAKAKERQNAIDKAEVNRSKINRNDTTSEMSIEISESLRDTSVGNQVLEYMKELDVDTCFVDEAINLTDEYQYYDVGNIVRWKRKVTSEYDNESDEWVPISRVRLQDEAHFLIYLTAIDFIKLVAGYATRGVKLTVANENVMQQNLNLYLTQLRSMYEDCTPILLIQGLDAWLKKNANAKNREYTAAVRAQAVVEDEESNPEISSSRSQTRRRKKSAAPAVDLSFVNVDIVDELMLHLQLHHQPIVVQRSTSPATSATEIVRFTQHLSTRPGRLAFQDFNLKSASFCMERGQVKTGDSAQETYVKMLQEVQRITPSMAYGIASEYQSLLKLVQGFRRSNNLMLEDVRKSTNKDGGWSDKKLGPMASKRLYKIFMGRDPAATDGMS